VADNIDTLAAQYGFKKAKTAVDDKAGELGFSKAGESTPTPDPVAQDAASLGFVQADPEALGFVRASDPSTASPESFLRPHPPPEGGDIGSRFFAEGKELLQSATVAPFIIAPRWFELTQKGQAAFRAETPEEHSGIITSMGLDPKDYPFEKRMFQSPMFGVTKEVAGQMGQAIKEDYADYVRDPATGEWRLSRIPERISERPFSAALDVSLLAGGAGVGLKAAGRVGKAAGAIQKAAPAAAKITKAGEALETAGKVVAAGPWEWGKAGIYKMLGGQKRMEYWNFVSRQYGKAKNKPMRVAEREVAEMAPYLEKIPAHEYPLFREYAEGLRPLAEASEATQTAVRQKWGPKMAEIWDEVVRQGGGTPETSVSRRFRPLVDNAAEQIKSLEGTKAGAEWEGKLNTYKKLQAIEERRELGLRVPKKDWDFWEANKVEPVYFPHIDADLGTVAKMKTVHVSADPRKFTPGFTKEMKNVKMNLVEAKEAHRRYTHSVESWKAHLKYIDDLATHPDVIELKDISHASFERMGKEGVWDKYHLFAPEAVTKLRRTKYGKAGKEMFDDFVKKGKGEGLDVEEGLMKYHKDLVKESDEINNALKKGRRAVEEDFFKKHGIEQAGSKVYLMPKDMANAVRGQMGSAGQFDKFIYHWDKGTNLLKRAWLTLPGTKWFMNNQLGNITFGALQGVKTGDYVKALFAKYKAVTPDELAGGFVKLEQRAAGKGAWAAERGLWKALEDSAIAKPVKGWSDAVLKYNGAVEEWFRRASYITEAEKLAKRNLFDAAGKSWFATDDQILKEMGRIKKNTKLTDKLIDDVEVFMGNYTKMLPVERRVFRRIVPFYSWIKHMTKLTAKLPTKYPKRTWMIKQLSLAGQEAWEDVPEYARGEAVVLGKDENGETLTMNLRGLPFADVGWEAWAKGLHPAIREPIERFTGKQFFNQREFDYPSSMYIKRKNNWYEPIPGQQPDGRGNYRDDQLRPVRMPAPHWSRTANLLPPVRMWQNWRFPYSRPSGGAIWDDTPRPQFGVRVRTKDRALGLISAFGPTIRKMPMTPEKGKKLERTQLKRAEIEQKKRKARERRTAQKLGISEAEEE